MNNTNHNYNIQGGPKKTHGFVAITAYSQSFFIFLAHVHYGKFATG